ncbi:MULTISPECIES: type 2 GTP cyclohydrolase I [Pantoea]|jgi:dinuclear metal center YbgI/SA1388 family protein|uniref:type 2 GTP cyclohydrolase I n=1 Tax=Pantoea TaxID=53335 RepID=UPI000EA245FE|nr:MULTISPECIES: type 2 GTP cyclohydrolase I [Pantoea]MDU6432434.1 type 2 GTP cyclohydrolase I [Pantoea sp.]MBZ6385806.1 type 2 GTP cyclohydrolase I [Pantoea piersonii]MBZ6400930.1 type 2 GTP cyclohydrolase I [Pantoea piersonii]MBZ6409550.1 type 2 GTP cyclohydrolase I [Pantoea piersonii]MBZ6428368.1 type 2 GTP cyclohydrolase I [Pantoea piersonii]
MNHYELENIVNQQLNSGAFSDYAPNGLQVEGRTDVKTLITGVTACQALVDEAVARNADAILVHHGYFWKSEPAVIKGMKRNRLRALLANDINLYGWHLPLDAHPTLGNNAQLAKLLDIEVKGEVQPLVFWGELATPLSGEALAQRIEERLGRAPLHCGDNAPAQIRRVAWCSGGGQGFIDSAAAFGVDAYITGEVSEQTIHSAREQGIHFFAAGHHATERGGIKALGEWLAEQHGLEVTFIDIPNPA